MKASYRFSMTMSVSVKEDQITIYCISIGEVGSYGKGHCEVIHE